MTVFWDEQPEPEEELPTPPPDAPPIVSLDALINPAAPPECPNCARTFNSALAEQRRYAAFVRKVRACHNVRKSDAADHLKVLVALSSQVLAGKDVE